MSPVHSRQMSLQERLAEICDLLTLGLLRRPDLSVRERDTAATGLRR